MSLKLSFSPNEIECNSGLYENIQIGNEEVSMLDFCCLVEYVMTNTDLVKNDPRINLRKKISELTLSGGFNPGGYRFVHNPQAEIAANYLGQGEE